MKEPKLTIHKADRAPMKDHTSEVQFGDLKPENWFLWGNQLCKQVKGNASNTFNITTGALYLVPADEGVLIVDVEIFVKTGLLPHIEEN